MGAKQSTFMGMSGLGDLVLTCTDNQSRNRRFGLALGNGLGIQEAMTEIGQVVEGYRNTKEVHILSKRMGVEMPICEQVYEVLYNNKPAKEAALTLLARSPTSE
jgi:glycerol-3-phosphate dehydrogenase (NAD(P)+)